MQFVAETDDGRIVGYVLGKLNDNGRIDIGDESEDCAEPETESNITSLSVLRTHRKLGIATKLMRATHR